MPGNSLHHPIPHYPQSQADLEIEHIRAQKACVLELEADRLEQEQQSRRPLQSIDKLTNMVIGGAIGITGYGVGEALIANHPTAVGALGFAAIASVSSLFYKKRLFS